MNKVLILLVALISLSGSLYTFANKSENAKKFTISGRIKDKKNGEDLIGASVYVKENKMGAATNAYGFYSLSIEPGNYTLIYSYIGFKTIEKTIALNSNQTINMELEEESKVTQEVVVTGEKANENVVKTEMSVVKLDAKMIQKIPALMGEVDVIKAIQMLPGVQSASEGSSGYSVRGGSIDQNLVVLDESTVYNASHLMGFFSVFNNDAIKDVKLYKGDIPAEYGGRLSSLLDVRMKDGNAKTLSGQGGIGTISSRFTIEAPIIKDKCSFMVAGRRSYADLFLKVAPNKDIRDNSLYFYDLNAKINYTINDKNRLYFSGYYGRDNFKFGSTDPFKMGWGNRTFTARWNHLFTEKLFSNFTVLLSDYDYFLGQDADISGFKWTSNLHDKSVKADLGYFLNPKNTIKFGAIVTYHTFEPGKVKGTGNSVFNEIKIPSSNAIETGFFISNEQRITNRLSASYGVRYSMFNCMGAATIYNYDEQHNAIDSTVYKSYDVFKTYDGWEPRASINYLINDASSIKAAYSRTKQYLHLASNSTGGSPLDVWIPSSPNTKPQDADQASIGYFRNFKNNMFETSLELYYKEMNNQVDFKDHATLLLNQKLEGEIRVGRAKSYGAEILIRKQTGKLTGWIAYTYSKALRKVPEINNGKEYNAPYDKTNNISIVVNYQINDRFSASANWVYSTGSPVTFPTGRFTYGNIIVPVYSDRNAYRMPDYHRLDLSVTYDFKKKEEQKWTHSVNFSVYNAYYRKNAYLISFRQDKDDPNKTIAEKVYLFPIIPAITYNFKF